MSKHQFLFIGAHVEKRHKTTQQCVNGNSISGSIIAKAKTIYGNIQDAANCCLSRGHKRRQNCHWKYTRSLSLLLLLLLLLEIRRILCIDWKIRRSSSNSRQIVLVILLHVYSPTLFSLRFVLLIKVFRIFWVDLREMFPVIVLFYFIFLPFILLLCCDFFSYLDIVSSLSFTTILNVRESFVQQIEYMRWQYLPNHLHAAFFDPCLVWKQQLPFTMCVWCVCRLEPFIVSSSSTPCNRVCTIYLIIIRCLAHLFANNRIRRNHIERVRTPRERHNALVSTD